MSLKLIRRILEARMPESMDAMSWAFLIAAADRADDNGDEIFQTVPGIGKRCCMGRTAAFDAKDRLVKLGLLVDTGERRECRRGGKTVVYRIDMSRLEKSGDPVRQADGVHANTVRNTDGVDTHPVRNTDGVAATPSVIRTEPSPPSGRRTSPSTGPGTGIGIGREGSAHDRAHSLALQFWELQGNPERHRKSVPDWEVKIRDLLAQEPELGGLLECLFSGDMPYWSPAWEQPSPDPMAFLLRKLAVPVEEPGIRRTWDEIRSRKDAARAKAKRRAQRRPPVPGDPPKDEPLWDIAKLRSACTQWVNGVNTGRTYYEKHKDEYTSLRPDWVEDIEWRIYGSSTGSQGVNQGDAA